jgi:hypothetical protein
VAILIAGIVVGSGVGYFYASSVYDPQITSFKGQVATLNGQISTLTSEKEAQATEITGLNTQITGLQNTITQRNQQITTLEGTVASYKTQVAGLQSDISNYKTQVGTLQTNFELSDGYLRVAAYGWSIQFPNGMYTRITGSTSGTSATTEAGKVYGYLLVNSAVTDWIEVNYSAASTAPDLDNAIMQKISDINLTPYITESSAKTSVTISGHAARYETLTFVYDGQTNYVIVAAWYCDETKTTYVYYREALTANSDAVWTHFVSTFACHVE